MHITYEFEDTDGGTMTRIRIQGEATGFYRLAGPMMSRAVKRNITHDLETLKDLMESGAEQGRVLNDRGQRRLDFADLSLIFRVG